MIFAIRQRKTSTSRCSSLEGYLYEHGPFHVNNANNSEVSWINSLSISMYCMHFYCSFTTTTTLGRWVQALFTLRHQRVLASRMPPTPRTTRPTMSRSPHSSQLLCIVESIESNFMYLTMSTDSCWQSRSFGILLPRVSWILQERILHCWWVEISQNCMCCEQYDSFVLYLSSPWGKFIDWNFLL